MAIGKRRYQLDGRARRCSRYLMIALGVVSLDKRTGAIDLDTISSCSHDDRRRQPAPVRFFSAGEQLVRDGATIHSYCWWRLFW